MFKKAFVVLAFVVLAFMNMAAAEEAPVNQTSADATAVEDIKTEPFMVNNKTCPVCGKKIAESVLGKNTIEYQNKIYNICSVGDRDLFLTDPDKYSRIADDEMTNGLDAVNSVPAQGSSSPTK